MDSALSYSAYGRRCITLMQVRPLRDLFVGRAGDFINVAVSVFRASIKGNKSLFTVNRSNYSYSDADCLF